MSAHRSCSESLEVSVQFATRRSGVPHASSLARWANRAFAIAIKSPEHSLPLTIRIVGAAESRRLNRTYRGKDKPTNVLSFPGMGAGLGAWGVGKKNGMRSARLAQDPSPAPAALELGDLAICAPVVAREAREQGKDPRAHWAHMVVHGVLHLLGYDHENDRDAAVMESREVIILSQFGYANPYG
jgi:probable rRNA maturation factor